MKISYIYTEWIEQKGPLLKKEKPVKQPKVVDKNARYSCTKNIKFN